MSTTAHGASGVSRILPDGCVEIVVALDGNFGLIGRAGARRPPRVTVVGHNTRPLETFFDDCRRIVGVRLTPAGALRLLGEALPHTVNGSTDCADIDPRLARDLSNAVEEDSAQEGPAPAACRTGTGTSFQ